MFMKKAVLAAALAAPLAFLASPASADHDVDVHFGIGIGTPHYGYGVYPDVYHRRKLSCWQARELVRDRGFRRVRTIECSGRNFTYAARRAGDVFRVSLNSRTGEIVSVRPM